MSWDISVQDIPDVSRVDDIPDDFCPRPLGPRSDVIALIQSIIPQVDFSDPSWGMLETPSYLIEFNMGADNLCDSFMLHVRGGGEAAEVIDDLLKRMKLKAFDCQAGDFFSLEAARSSFSDWQDYRDQVISPEPPSP